MKTKTILRKVVTALALVTLMLSALPAKVARADTQSWTTAGTYSWTAPAGVTSVTVEAWGGGGRGAARIGGSYTSGGGGGGGGYSKLNSYTVIPGNSYTVVVGAGSSSGTTPGGSSYFGDSSAVLAYGGNSAPDQGGTALGAALGVGDITYAGGNGVNGTGSTGYCGGGGGSSAGPSSNGTNATGNAGAVAPGGGGNGGAGKGCGSTGNGSAGVAPGGAGGGGVKWSSGSGGGGAGAAGKVVITYKYDTTTSVSCTPNPVIFGSNSSCTATVTRSGSALTPTGTITWSLPGGDSGGFSAGTCVLSGSGASTSCSVTYTPSAVGDASHGITATYGNDTNFNGSSGSQDLIVQKYTVTYHANSADSGTVPADQTKVYNVTLVLATNSGSLARAGYTFSGWNTQANGLGINYATGGNYTDNASATLYAKWTATSQTVTYALGGGTGTLPTQANVLTDGTFIVATGAGLSRSGYTFNGWHDGTNPYAASSTYTMGASNVTLTAQWTATSQTVTYALGGGTGTLPTQANVLTDGTFIVATGAGLSRSGYTFNGWHDGTNPYAASSTYTMGASNVTLTAQWTATSQTVTYALGGGTGTLPTQANVLTDGTFIVATGAGLSRSGYTFNGWHDGTNPYAVSSTYTMGASNVTLTAQWTATSQTVTYALGGGTGTLPTQANVLTDGTFIVATGAGLSRSGYTFNGWHDGTNPYAASSTYTMGANNVTLTAQWSTFTVTFNNNGGTGTMTAQNNVVATPLKSNSFTRTGFVFAGWNTAANGSGTVYADNASYSFTANVTLYAQWLIDVPSTFSDVPITHWANGYVERLYKFGVTSGCGNGNYCPEGKATRAEMAIFILRAKYGKAYAPPPATGTVFADVPVGAFADAWIEQLAKEGITTGCGNGNYCPNAPITRAQMSVFLLRGKYGSAYTPPAATGIVFSDVSLTSFAAAWIEQLAKEGITSGCGNGNYCPDNSVTRAEMAVFLVKAFGLP